MLQPLATDRGNVLGYSATSPEGVSVAAERLVARGGSGSWVRDADWNEFVVALRNAAPRPVTIQALELESEGLPASQHAMDREALEDRTRRNLETLKTVGVFAGSTLAGVSIAAIGAATAGGLAMLAALPVSIVAGSIYGARRIAQRARDRDAIDAELSRRGLRLPATIAPAGELRGSAFFPLTSTASRIRVRYDEAGTRRELVLDFPAMQGPPPR